MTTQATPGSKGKQNNKQPSNGAVEAPAVRYEAADGDGVGIVWIDVPGQKVNTLSARMMPHFERAFTAARADASLRALVIASGKEKGFIAGADIGDLNDVTTAADGARLSRDGQAAMDRIAGLGVPTVAAIHGDCLGGGLELALACSARVATDSKRTKLATPEVMLGLLPGAGGTVRLPELIGLTGALDMMLTGRNIRAAKALKMGLVDRVVPPNQLMRVAREVAHDMALGKPARTPKKQAMQQEVQDVLLERNALGRRVVLHEARKKVMKQTHGLYPAPLEILEVVARGSFKAEAEAFGKLLVTAESRSLRHVFHCITTLKKFDGPGTEGVEARPMRHIGMLGAGLMGAGIASVLADKGLSVRLKDIDRGALTRAFDYAGKVFKKARRRKVYNSAGVGERMNRISGGLSWAGMAHAEVVIEAVLENMPLKREMIAEIEARTRVDAIFATNTSALPITEIAAKAKHPERVIGMHFFSPVEKMPLVEIIVHDKTDPVVARTTAALARKMGKHVIVVNDCAGFYTTRVLAPYMIEATFLAIEGNPIEAIDEAAIRLGFPVGPIALMDEVGIDVGQKVLATMKEYYSAHMEFPPDAIGDFIAEGRLGRKANKGFYVYEDGKSKTERGHKVVDEAVYRHMPNGTSTKAANLDEMGERLLLALVNEAIRCRQEGVLFDCESGDLGAIMGIGFPPMVGGPFFYTDRHGAKNIAARLRALELRYGKRFEPAELLVELADKGGQFYD